MSVPRFGTLKKTCFYECPKVWDTEKIKTFKTALKRQLRLSETLFKDRRNKETLFFECPKVWDTQKIETLTTKPEIETTTTTTKRNREAP